MIGNILERNVKGSPPTAPTLAHTSTGFPKAQHRSKKSAFLQSRQSSEPPPQPTPPSQPQPTSDIDTLSPRELDENERIVRGMTDQEREEERQAILARFGSNIGDVLKRARLARTASRYDWNERTFWLHGLTIHMHSVAASSSSEDPPKTEPTTQETRQYNFLFLCLLGSHLYLVSS